MEALGINIVDILIYIVLFFILYSVINSKVVRPLIDVIEKRKEEILENNKNKEKISEELENFEVEKDSIKNQLKTESKDEGSKIIASAKLEAKEILNKAKLESDEILSKAKSIIEIERTKYQQELNAKFENVLEQTIQEVYKTNKTEFDKSLIEKAIKQLN
jgi:F0F1-type ATP synthase membrane subunit b/b'